MSIKEVFTQIVCNKRGSQAIASSSANQTLARCLKKVGIAHLRK